LVGLRRFALLEADDDLVMENPLSAFERFLLLSFGIAMVDVSLRSDVWIIVLGAYRPSAYLRPLGWWLSEAGSS
jgi:hypothetical protein